MKHSLGKHLLSAYCALRIVLSKEGKAVNQGKPLPSWSLYPCGQKTVRKPFQKMATTSGKLLSDTVREGMSLRKVTWVQGKHC